EATPGFSGYVTGRVASIQLRTGGTISYAYTGGNNGIVCSDGSTAGLNRTTPDSATPWNYSRSNPGGTAWTTALLSPTSDKTVINCQKNGSNFYETLRQVYQGQTTVLQTLYTCYNGAAADCSSIGITLPISRITTTTQLDNGQQSKTDTFLNG